MIAKEFDEIQRTLSSRYKLCEDSRESFRWYESLKAYDFSVVKEAVDDWIINDGFKPALINIVDRCNDVLRWRQKIREAEEPNVKTIACPHCRDTGLVTTVSPTGVLMGHPCEHCSRGKKNYPWHFLSEDERREYNEKEIKAGRAVVKENAASKDFYDWYVYGKVSDAASKEEAERAEKLDQFQMELKRRLGKLLK